MQWDVSFLVRNLRPEYCFRTGQVLMLEPGEKFTKDVAAAMADEPDVANFFASGQDGKLILVIFRLEADREDEALARAKHQIEGFIDGMSVVLDRDLPVVCSLVQIRESNQPHAKLVRLGKPNWAYFTAKNEATAKAWAERQLSVHRSMVPFFNIVSDLDSQHQTSLTRQLQHSMKMFRAGAETADFGLEFICKWSGLEGLVCGGETKGKKLMLKNRLPALMKAPANETEDLVEKLWNFRNQAVHEALAFHSDYLEDAPVLAVYIEPVERLFLATVTFALAHLAKASSVPELWPHVATYQLPQNVLEKRPKEMHRWPVVKMKFDTDRHWAGGGAIIDGLFAKLAVKSKAATADKSLSIDASE